MIKKVIFSFFLFGLSFSSLMFANETRLFFFDDHILLEDGDWDFNLWDRVGQPIGLVVDPSGTHYYLQQTNCWIEGGLRREYDPRQSLSAGIEYRQRFDYSPGQRIFQGNIGFTKQILSDQYRALNIDPYRHFFQILDYSAGTMAIQEIPIQLAYAQRIYRQWVLAPFLEYRLLKSLRDEFIKAENTNRTALWGINLGYVGPRRQSGIELAWGNEHTQLEAPKELANPIVEERFGSNVSRVRTGSSCDNWEKIQTFRFRGAWLEKISPQVNLLLNMHYNLWKNVLSDGGSTRRNWGLYQEEIYAGDLEFHFLPSGSQGYGLRVGWQMKDAWSRSYDYPYLYQESNIPAFSGSLYNRWRAIPVILTIYQQCEIEIGNYKHFDYLADIADEYSLSAFAWRFTTEYYLNERWRVFPGLAWELKTHDLELEGKRVKVFEVKAGAAVASGSREWELTFRYRQSGSSEEVRRRFALESSFRFL